MTPRRRVVGTRTQYDGQVMTTTRPISGGRFSVGRSPTNRATPHPSLWRGGYTDLRRL